MSSKPRETGSPTPPRTPYDEPTPSSGLGVPALLPHALLLIGAVLGLLALFFPLLDDNKVARAQQKLDEGDLAQARFEQELKEDPSAATDPQKQSLLVDKRNKWRKERVNFQAEVDTAKATAKRSAAWYLWAALLALLAVAVGSLTYLTSGELLLHRIVGAVLFTALLLMLLGRFLLVTALHKA